DARPLPRQRAEQAQRSNGERGTATLRGQAERREARRPRFRLLHRATTHGGRAAREGPERPRSASDGERERRRAAREGPERPRSASDGERERRRAAREGPERP